MRTFRRTTLIAVFCFSILTGIGFARKAQFLPAEAVLILWPLLFILKKKNVAALILVILLGLGMGLWRGSIYMQKLAELKNLSGQKVSVQVQATSDGIYSTANQLEFTAGKAKLLPTGRRLAGSFKISGFGLKAVYRGDEVTASGKLYPMRGSNQARIAYAQLNLIKPGVNWFADFSRRFAAGLQNVLPEPVASFAMGLLAGQRVNIPAVVTAELTAVGLVHIVAVSGYNLTILVRAVERLRLRSKYQKLLASLVLIAGFLAVTGFSASIVRAAVVSVLGLWAWYFGRTFRPIVLLAFAAALTGLINPFYVWGDLSWYLSFLAFFGILIIAPVIQARLFKRKPKIITSVLLETFSAEIMTLPLIMLSFSQLSLVALLANLIVVPLVPVAMLASAVAGFAGMIIPQIGGWLAWPASILLTYMLDIVHLLAKIPSALVHASLSTSYMLVFYALVLFVLAVAHHKTRVKQAANTLKVLE